MDFEKLPDARLWQEALRFYAARDWFMVHEVLEVLWKRNEGELAKFYQAFLQAGVSMYHYGNANFQGARQLAVSAISRLTDLPATFHGVEVRRYRDDFEVLMSSVINRAPDRRPMKPGDEPPIHAAR